MDYIFRRLSQENLPDFISVYEAAFNKIADHVYLKAKFNTKFSGKDVLGYLAYSEETMEPVAYYGVFPIMSTYNNQNLLIAQSGNTATHPHFQRQGLFKKLHDLTVESCKEEGVYFIFGFPNSNSYPGFIKFGWSHECDTNSGIIRIKIPTILKFSRKIDPVRAIKKKERIKANSIDISKLNRSSLKNGLFAQVKGGILIQRTPEYLDYKCKLGSFVIRLNNGLAWLTLKGNFLHIGDLFSDNHVGLLNELIELCSRLGIDQIVLESSSKDILKSLQTKRINFDITKSAPLILNKTKLHFQDELFNYTGGDFDYY